MDISLDRQSASSRYERPDILLLIVAALLVFSTLGSRMFWGSEGRWAEVTREMMLTGDYFHPTINGEPYFDKPLVTYWVIAAVARLTGRLDEFAVRLPSAIAGLLAIWATLRLGAKLWSPAVGRMAACIAMTCYGVLLWSRSGAADTENLATVTLCTLWYWHRRERLGFATLLVLYLMVFVGSHMKGPVAAVVTGLVILPDAIREGRWKAFVRPSALLALAIGLVVFFAPFLWASRTNTQTYQSSGLALVWQENFQRFLSPIDHMNPIYTYVVAIPELILPWSPLFICALIAAIKERKHLDERGRWLIWVIALIFVFFTACRSRRWYYILSVAPFCGLLTAVAWMRLRESASAAIIRLGVDIQKYVIYGAAAVELIAGLVCLAIPAKKAGGSLASIGVVCIITAMAALVAGKAAWQLRGRFAAEPEEEAFVPLAAVAVVIMGGFFCVQQSVLEGYRSERQFVTELKVAVAKVPAERVCLLQKGEVDAKMVFYVGKESPVTLLRYNSRESDKARLAANAATVADFLKSPLPGVLIAQARYAADLPSECRSLLSLAPDIEESATPFESKSSGGERWQAWFLNHNSTIADRR